MFSSVFEYVYACAYVHVCLCACCVTLGMHTYTQAYIHTYIHTWMDMQRGRKSVLESIKYMDIHMTADFMHTYMHACIHIHEQTGTLWRRSTNACIYTHAYIHMHIYTCANRHFVEKVHEHAGTSHVYWGIIAGPIVIPHCMRDLFLGQKWVRDAWCMYAYVCVIPHCMQDLFLGQKWVRDACMYVFVCMCVQCHIACRTYFWDRHG